MLDVVILNAYHRGDWLVEQFKGSPYAVETLDITDLVGVREEADTHGPFGFFEGENPEVEEWLLKTQQVRFQRSGCVVWTNKGTFESAGALRDYQLSAGATGDGPNIYETMMKSWLETVDRPAQLLKHQPAMAPMADKGYLLCKQFLVEREKRRTVKSSDTFHLKVQPGQKTITWNDHVFESQFVVSFLLPHELMALAPRGVSQLLTEEPLRPRLCWQRARFRLESPFSLASLPEQFLMVTDTQNPLCEENFIVLQKSTISGEWDVWFRTWYEVHKEKKYFSGLQKRIVGVLQLKIPDLQATCVQAPLETTEKSAFSLYPIYDLQEWALHTKWYTGGVFYAGQDKCENFSLTESVNVQKRIFKHIDEELKGG